MLLTPRELHVLEGKAIAKRITNDEMLSVFAHIDAMEAKLDEADEQDMLGTEGWRHWFGVD